MASSTSWIRVCEDAQMMSRLAARSSKQPSCRVWLERAMPGGRDRRRLLAFEAVGRAALWLSTCARGCGRTGGTVGAEPDGY